ncbi:MAG: ATP-binding protein [Chthoniobacterales bacterium]|nr:ATP-binding protein [Chthoniobacterales bacterium]
MDEERIDYRGREEEIRKLKIQQEWETKWSINYPNLTNTDISLLPCEKQIIEKVLACEGSACLYGNEKRSGKTRLAFMLLKKHFMNGKRCDFYHALRLSSEASQAARDCVTYEVVKKIVNNTDCILLDDIGKTKISESVGLFIYGIIDLSIVKNKIILVTTNFVAQELEDRFEDKDQAEAVIQRIREACQLFFVKKNNKNA